MSKSKVSKCVRKREKFKYCVGGRVRNNMRKGHESQGYFPRVGGGNF